MAVKMSIHRGVTYDIVYHHENSTGDPVPLTGCTIYFTVKTEEWDTNTTDTSAVIKKTTSVHTNAAAGLSGWKLTDADTQVAEPGDYYFDIIVEDASGESLPPCVIGAFIVKPKQTNRNV